MTCIVGLEHDGKVYLGGDSIAIEDYSAFLVSDSKVFTIGDQMIMGFCSSYRIGQLLHYGLKLPPHEKGKSDMEYLVIDFVDAMRNLCRDKGVLKKENELEEVDGKFLVGYKGSLYWIDEDFQVGRGRENYVAVGAGQDIALGSLFSTEKLIADPRERINIALSASAKWSAAVRPPFTIVVLDTLKPKPKKKS